MSRNEKELKSAAIAQATAALTNACGGVGPFGGETCEVDWGNQINLNSQACDENYEFDEKGQVTLVDAEDAYDQLREEYESEEEYTDEEIEEEIGTREEFVEEHTNQSIEQFTDPCGWYGGASERLRNAYLEFVKAIVEEKMN